MTATDKTLPLQTLFPFPDTWDGTLLIRGCSQWLGNIEEAHDLEAEFFGIYARDSEGLHMWVEDCDTREQAEDLAKYLKAQFPMSIA